MATKTATGTCDTGSDTNWSPSKPSAGDTIEINGKAVTHSTSITGCTLQNTPGGGSFTMDAVTKRMQDAIESNGSMLRQSVANDAARLDLISKMANRLERFEDRLYRPYTEPPAPAKP